MACFSKRGLIACCIILLNLAHAASAIRCYQQDPSQLTDCAAAGACEQMSLPTYAENGDDYNISGVAYTAADLAHFYPPYPPILNMTIKYSTCYFAMLKHIPDALPPKSSPSNLRFYASMLGSRKLGSRKLGSTSSNTGPDTESGPDYDGNTTGDDGPGVVVMQGGGTADQNDPFHSYAACMDTWSNLNMELMLMQPIIGGTNNLAYYCCTTTGCNYGPDGLTPGAVPPPHPKHMYRPRPPPLSSPAPIQPSPHDNHPTEPVSAGSDGAVIGLRVFLAILLVTVVGGGVWFFCKQRKPAPAPGPTGDEGKKPANSEAAGLLTGHVALSSLRA